MLRLAVILCNDTVRTMLLNNARGILFTVAPSFPMLAAIRATYMLLETGKTQPVSLLCFKQLRAKILTFMRLKTDYNMWSNFS
jgi:8-amino-7-oxononanoate synthase